MRSFGKDVEKVKEAAKNIKIPIKIPNKTPINKKDPESEDKTEEAEEAEEAESNIEIVIVDIDK